MKRSWIAVVVAVYLAFGLRALLLIDATALWSDELYASARVFSPASATFWPCCGRTPIPRPITACSGSGGIWSVRARSAFASCPGWLIWRVAWSWSVRRWPLAWNACCWFWKPPRRGILKVMFRLTASASPVVFLVNRGEEAERVALTSARDLWAAGFQVELDATGLAFGKQFKRADRSGARWAMVLGDDEFERGEVRLRPLKQQGEEGSG